MAAIKQSQTNAMILLLDSEPVVRSVLEEVLGHAGYLVHATGDLGKAVDVLHESRIDLLITHPSVDDITGHEAAKYLRKTNPQMGVLIIAGFLDDERLLNREDFEGFEMFPAPFTAAQLIEKIEQTLKTARARAPQT
jgi:DNA-binding NtrC family response regulator